MNFAHASYPPYHILGITIHSRSRIYVSYIIPNALELLVYIVQIAADCAVSYQHFKSHQNDFGWATLGLILIPPVITCLLVLSSKSRWIKPKQNGTRVLFICLQLAQMLFFPFFVIYRLTKLVFWSIEALFHNDDDKVRMECLEKAEECSTCELYRLIQAYGQSAPQILLQLFHMLSEDLFRDFQTTNVQAISLVFSAIDLASISTTYQRFESQKQVGRHYPWSAEQEIEKSYLKIQKNKYFQEECLRKKHNSDRSLSKFPESDKIIENFKAKTEENKSNNQQQLNDNNNISTASQESLNDVSSSLSHTVQVHVLDDLENEAADEQTVLLAAHLTDDDKIKTKPVLYLNVKELTESFDQLDKVPNTPPPLPPKIVKLDDTNEAGNRPGLRTQKSNQSNIETNKRYSKAFSQLDTFKQMLLMNAQLYIKENVPRPPKKFIKGVDNTDNPINIPAQTPNSPKDEVDFFLPAPVKVVKGIQQDDFAAKTVAFFGWISFVIMRMLSLSAFSVFFPKAFLIIMGAHYSIMLASLYLESQFKGNLNKTLSHFLLAYVYIYVLLEFKVKFKRIRIWFVSYFLLAMTENLTMTLVWYSHEEFESWWFDFIFEGIIYSGILFVATIIVYYFLLKPNDVIFFIEDEVKYRN